MNLLENTEGKAVPQSLAFSDWETEKQKVRVVSPHFTLQVTPLHNSLLFQNFIHPQP